MESSPIAERLNLPPKKSREEKKKVAETRVKDGGSRHRYKKRDRNMNFV